MMTLIKVELTKIFFALSFLIFVLPVSYAFSNPNKNCEDNPFKTEIISFEKNDECYSVTIEVSHNNKVQFELSHANFDFGCGWVENASNSEQWPIELNSIDPVTGIGGIKVDNIEGFGKNDQFNSFLVEFTYCPEDQCADNANYKLNVGYKAGQCIYYETIENEQESLKLTYDISKSSPTCNDGNDGEIQIANIDGAEPIEIIWDNGLTGLKITSLSAGNYLFTIKDANGAQETGEVILQQAEGFEIEGTVTQPDCQGLNNGSISLLIDGGDAPYYFEWNNGSTEQNLLNLSAGNFTVKVTDSKGCTNDGSFSVSNKTSLQLDAVITQPSCQENNPGSIDLLVSGGEEPYSYTWSNGSEEASVGELEDGYHSVKVKDQNNCEFNRTFVIKSDVGIYARASVAKTNCFDDPEGSIDLTITGGTEPISIEWSNGATTEDIEGLVSGNYTATITDALGCQLTYNTSVSKNDIRIGYNAITVPSCNNMDDGSIDIYLTNGTEPYTFIWSNGAETEDIENLSAGTYSLTVTDEAGCTAERILNLPEPDQISIDHQIEQNTCTGSQNLIVFASGGSLDYTYAWPDGNTTNTIENVQAGIYSVTVTDSKSCSVTKEISVGESDPAQNCAIQDLNQEVSCGSSGNILESSIGNAIVHNWSVKSSDGSWLISSPTNQTNILFSSGSAGSNATFSLTVTFENGCEITCEKVIEACVSQDDSGDENPDDDSSNDNPDDDPTNGDDSNDGDNSDPDGENDPGDSDDTPSEPNGENNTPDKERICEDCFFTNPITISKTDYGYAYTIIVNHESCRYDLSHLVIEIPECIDVIDYSNSMNWKMEIVQNDPTTGITGIKIDDIPSFGKEESFSSFTINLLLNSTDTKCTEELTCFSPTIAYKASTCVFEEVTKSECLINEITSKINTYPNPANEYVNVSVESINEGETYSIELLDFNGEILDSFIKNHLNKENIIIDLTSKKDGLYLIKVTDQSGKYTIQKLMKM